MKEIDLEKIGFKNDLRELKESTSKIEYLTRTYNYLITKYKGSIKNNIFNFFDLFLSPNKIFERKFLSCTTFNYLMESFLIRGAFFKPEDIELKWTLLWYVSPHQYLSVKIDQQKIIDIDLWAASSGIKFGDYAHGFHLKTDKKLELKEIQQNQLESLIENWQNQNKNWHFHLLTPDCSFNQNQGRHALIIENITDDQVYVVYSEKRLIDVGKRLVQILHGQEILDQKKDKDYFEDEKIREVVNLAKNYNQRGVLWHHHLFFPRCLLNKHPGKWNIIFENKETNKLTEILYDREPQDDLRKIEILYYQQKE